VGTGGWSSSTTFLAVLQWTIYEIDNKFEGVIQVEPIYTELLVDEMTSVFIEECPEVSLPCDIQGTPRRRSSSSTPSTGGLITGSTTYWLRTIVVG
jgi:hypothetical protein